MRYLSPRTAHLLPGLLRTSFMRDDSITRLCPWIELIRSEFYRYVDELKRELSYYIL